MLSWVCVSVCRLFLICSVCRLVFCLFGLPAPLSPGPWLVCVTGRGPAVVRNLRMRTIVALFSGEAELHAGVEGISECVGVVELWREMFSSSPVAEVGVGFQRHATRNRSRLICTLETKIGGHEARCRLVSLPHEKCAEMTCVGADLLAHRGPDGIHPEAYRRVTESCRKHRGRALIFVLRLSACRLGSIKRGAMCECVHAACMTAAAQPSCSTPPGAEPGWQRDHAARHLALGIGRALGVARSAVCLRHALFVERTRTCKREHALAKLEPASAHIRGRSRRHCASVILERATMP